MPGTPLTLVKMGDRWQPVPTAVAGDVLSARASNTSVAEYTAPPTRKGTASALDNVSVGATGVAVATAADAPPVAAIAGGVSEVAAIGAFVLDPSTPRAFNVVTVGAIGALKAAARGSAAAVESVRTLEKATQADTLLEAAKPPSQQPNPPPPPPEKDQQIP